MVCIYCYCCLFVVFVSTIFLFSVVIPRQIPFPLFISLHSFSNDHNCTLLFSSVLFVLAFFHCRVKPQPVVSAFHSISAVDIDGNVIPFTRYIGKVTHTSLYSHRFIFIYFTILISSFFRSFFISSHSSPLLVGKLAIGPLDVIVTQFFRRSSCVRSCSKQHEICQQFRSFSLSMLHRVVALRKQTTYN
jgi:hypothetical protein